MSYDISLQRHAAHSRVDPVVQPTFEDIERGKFLKSLDAAEIEVSDFEASFIETFLKYENGFRWSEPRRMACDKMRKVYESRVSRAGSRVTFQPIPSIQPGKCSYLIRGEAGQVRCGQPATERNAHGAEFCRGCWQKIVEYLDRKRQAKARR